MECTSPAGEIIDTVIRDTIAENKQPDVSDETFDHPCQPCLDEDKNIESKKYCIDCCEYLCETCINYHKKFKATKTHELLNKTDVKTEQQKQLLEECFQHSGKHIKLFCGSHNQLCCSTCRDVYHDECDGVVSIAEAASAVVESQELKDVVNELGNAQQELEKVISTRELDYLRIELEKNTALKALNSTREKVMAIFDTLKLLDENKIVKKAESLTLDIHKDLDKCYNEMATLKNTLTVLNDPGEDNVSRFVKMKRAKQNVISANALSEISLTKAGAESLVYSENSGMVENFLKFKQFGQIQDVTGIKTILKPKKVGVALLSEQFVQIECICDMHGLNSIMFTDSFNSNLKFTNEFSAVQELQNFDKKPGDVCKLDNYSFNYALAFPYDNQVKIFSYYKNKPYSEQHTINTKSTCNGLAFHNSKLYIACAGVDMTSSQGQGYIDIYTTDAKHIRSITCDGKRLIHSPERLASYKNSKHIYALERSLGLTKITKHAEINPKVTKLPNKCERGGIDVNEEGHVFVLNHVGNKINLFGPDEVEVGPILSEIDVIVKPTAIMCTSCPRKLYVAMKTARN